MDLEDLMSIPEVPAEQKQISREKAVVQWIQNGKPGPLSILTVKSIFDPCHFHRVAGDMSPEPEYLSKDGKIPGSLEAGSIKVGKIYVGRWSGRGKRTFHLCKVAKISNKKTELDAEFQRLSKEMDKPYTMESKQKEDAISVEPAQLQLQQPAADKNHTQNPGANYKESEKEATAQCQVTVASKRKIVKTTPKRPAKKRVTAKNISIKALKERMEADVAEEIANDLEKVVQTGDMPNRVAEIESSNIDPLEKVVSSSYSNTTSNKTKVTTATTPSDQRQEKDNNPNGLPSVMSTQLSHNYTIGRPVPVLGEVQQNNSYHQMQPAITHSPTSAFSPPSSKNNYFQVMQDWENRPLSSHPFIDNQPTSGSTSLIPQPARMDWLPVNRCQPSSMPQPLAAHTSSPYAIDSAIPEPPQSFNNLASSSMLSPATASSPNLGSIQTTVNQASRPNNNVTSPSPPDSSFGATFKMSINTLHDSFLSLHSIMSSSESDLELEESETDERDARSCSNIQNSTEPYLQARVNYLEKALKQQKMWNSGMESLLKKLLEHVADLTKKNSGVSSEEPCTTELGDEDTSGHSEADLSRASKNATSCSDAVRTLGRMLFNKNELEQCSVQGIQTHKGKERRPALPMKKRFMLNKYVKKHWKEDIKTEADINKTLQELLKDACSKAAEATMDTQRESLK